MRGASFHWPAVGCDCICPAYQAPTKFDWVPSSVPIAGTGMLNIPCGIAPDNAARVQSADATRHLSMLDSACTSAFGVSQPAAAVVTSGAFGQ